MSKPKPRASVPIRPAGQVNTPPAKFYDGPTVSTADKPRRKSSPNVPSSQQDAYKPTPVHELKKSAVPASQLQVVKVPRRKKRSGLTLWGLITLLPVLLFASLFSTVLCPPPSSKPSSFSAYALGTLGLKVESSESSLHRTFCYPANVYHQEVLVPYVYPAIEDAKTHLHQSPLYRDILEPRYNVAKGHAGKLWNGPIKPVVDRTYRGAKIVHRTYIAPHVPYVKAKFTEATAPLRMRLYALYLQYIAPHVQVAKKHACTAYKGGKATYSQVAGHPMTAQAGKHAQNAFFFSKAKGAKAYEYTRPHAIWAYNEGLRHTHQTVLPRTAQGLKFAGTHVDNSWNVVKARWTKLYAEHLAVHLDPYVAKIYAALEPLIVTLEKQVYVPFIQPAVHSVFPPADKPRSIWSYIVPAAGTVGAAEAVKEGVKKAVAGTEDKVAAAKATAEAKAAAIKEAAEAKAKEAKTAVEAKAAQASKAAAETKKEAEEKAKKEAAEQAAIEAEIAANARAAFKKAEASRDAKLNTNAKASATASESSTSISATASPSVSCDSTTGAAATDKPKDHLAEAQAQVSQLKKKVDFQGKALYAKVQTETVKQAERFLELLPEMKKIGDENLDREIGRMIGGLDRLYSNSRSLTRDQVDESQRMSDAKVLKVLEQVTNGVKTKKNQIYEKVQPAVTNAQTEIDRVLGDEYAALGKRLSIIEGVTSKDWDAYKALKKDVAAWKGKFAEAPEKTTTKQLKEVTHKVQVGAAEAMTDFADSYEGWKTRQAQLRKQAIDRVEAREAVSSESKRATQATIAVPKKKEEGKGSILDMKDKEQKKEAAGSPLLSKVDKDGKKDEL